MCPAETGEKIAVNRTTEDAKSSLERNNLGGGLAIAI